MKFWNWEVHSLPKSMNLDIGCLQEWMLLKLEWPSLVWCCRKRQPFTVGVVNTLQREGKVFVSGYIFDLLWVFSFSVKPACPCPCKLSIFCNTSSHPCPDCSQPFLVELILLAVHAGTDCGLSFWRASISLFISLAIPGSLWRWSRGFLMITKLSRLNPIMEGRMRLSLLQESVEGAW